MTNRGRVLTDAGVWVEIDAYVEPEVVTVTLGGDGGGSFDMSPDKSTITAGPAVFILYNVGAIVHECLILSTDDTAADVVAAAVMGGLLDESQYDVVADSGDIPAGNYSRFDLTLSPGHYVLVCNETGHAHLGMAADFEVTLLAGATLASVTR